MVLKNHLLFPFMLITGKALPPKNEVIGSVGPPFTFLEYENIQFTNVDELKQSIAALPLNIAKRKDLT